MATTSTAKHASSTPWILILLSARGETEEVLRRLGYEAVQEQQEGDLLRHQVTLVKTSGQSRYTVDVHWRALDPPIFADAFAYQTLADASVEIPRLGPMARGLHPVHALLLACVHRVAHHREHRPLIWVYDIHLLASTFGLAEWRRFLTEAEQFRIGVLCKNGLELAAQTFGTLLPEALLQDRRFARTPDDPAARYLEPTRRADIVVGDLQALPDWRSRLRLISQYLFPRADYMRQTYAPASRLPLPLLYLVRIGRGARKWLVRSANG